MKRFKKLLSTLLVCIMILGSISVCSAENIDVLKGMGIAPDSFAENIGEEPVTRGEYAYMMANLLNKDAMDPMDTRFTDVTSADYFSGHVEFLATRGVAGGYGDGTFGKSDPVSLETAYVFLIRVLGLESFVRANEASDSNFTTFAYAIGLKAGKYTNAEGYVTKNGAAAIVHDALTAELPKAEWSTEGGELILNTNTGSVTNLLSKNLGISAYDAYVQNVDMEKYTVTLEITKNKYNTNPLSIAEGTVKKFIASANINIYEYDHTPVTVWINEDEQIIDIQYKKDVEIKYVNIVSVNGDDDEHSYRVGNIERMTFLDDEEEYDVAEDATYKLNGVNFTGQTALVGNYAKVVLYKNEITHVESWDFVEGGIIEEITNNKITYIQGSETNTLSKLDDYTTKMYFVGGRNASANELKEGSVFYYYKNEAKGYLAIVASEIIVTDVLSSISTDSVTIGNNILSYDDKFYFKTDGNTYKASDISNDFIGLYNENVQAYVAHNGKVLYLALEDPSTIKGAYFYGVVLGVEPDRRDSDLADIKIISLDDEKINEGDYKITEKTKYKDDLALTDLIANSRDLYGYGIYKFKVNTNNEITQVAKPLPYPGFETPEESRATVTARFSSMTDGSLYVNSSDFPSNPVFLKTSRIYTIDEVSGKFEVGILTYDEVKGKTPPSQGVNLIVYGEEKSLTPALVVMTSAEGTRSLGAFGKGTEAYGVITNKTVAYIDGIKKTKLVVEGTDGIKTYHVEPSYAASYGIDTFIKYSPSGGENEIVILSSASMSGAPETWNLSAVVGSSSTCIIDTAYDNGFISVDNKIGFYRPGECKFFVVDMSGEETTYQAGKATDIAKGDRLFYYANDGIKLVVVVKE